MATTSASLTTASSATLADRQPAEASTLVVLSGTYGTCTFVIEGSIDGTNFFPLSAIALSTGAIVTGTISPTDNDTVGYLVPSEGLVAVRARATLVTSGQMDFALRSGSFIGNPLISVNNAGSITMTQFNATIGASTAAAGSTSADCGALPAATGSVYPTTAADDSAGVRINAAEKVNGRTLFIGNGVSNKILKVYPPAGGTINGAAANAAFSSASGKGVIATCLSASSNTWFCW